MSEDQREVPPPVEQMPPAVGRPAFWIRLLPASLRQRLIEKQSLSNLLSNIGWLFMDKILRMGVALVVMIWITRYLGGDLFGTLNFALALVGVAEAVTQLGLQNVTVRRLVRCPEQRAEVLGTTLALRFAAAVLGYGGVLAAIFWMRPDDPQSQAAVAILGGILLFRTSDVVKYWFESQVSSRNVVLVENAVILLSSAAKVALLLSQASFLDFVVVWLVEVVLSAIALAITYLRSRGAIWPWVFSRRQATEMLHESWPLMLSSIAAMIYLKIDQVMLGQMIGDQAVGICSVATRLSETWYFVPVAIVGSVFPGIVQARERSIDEYRASFQRLYNILVLLAVMVAVPTTFLADWIILVLFGPEYQASGPVLSVHIWAGVFVFLGVASGRWMFLENCATLAFKRSLIGAVANILLNLWLIPLYGPLGTAWATVVSYALVNLVSDLFQKRTHEAFYMKMRALNVFATLISLRRGLRGTSA